MHFIKYNLIWVPYTPKSCREGQSCYNSQGDLVVPFRRDARRLLFAIQGAIGIIISDSQGRG